MWKITDTVETTTTTNQDSELLQLVKQLQAKVDKLESKDEPAGITKKERYNWPLTFSYKTWDWIPVLSYKSVKKDSARPLRYKLPNGEHVDNHYVELQLADGKTTKQILAYDFWMHVTLSEQQTAWIMTKDWYEIPVMETKHSWQVEPEYYIFNTEEYGKINVYPNCIN